MSGGDDDHSSTNGRPHNGRAADTAEGATPDDPRVTPLGGNAGVHIRTDDEEEHSPEIDFGSFIVSLGTSCMVNLGQHPNPETGQVLTDLPAAQQVIEILEMLKHKTRGNLELEEEKLLETLLFDLRNAYDNTGQ